MAKEEEEFDPTEDQGDFVPAVYVKTIEQAEEYRELLNDHDIPAMVGEEEGGRRRGVSRGLPVLVPEVLLDEASEIIAEYEEEAQLDEEDEELDEDEDEEEEEDEEFEFDEDEDEDDLDEDDEFEEDDLFEEEEPGEEEEQDEEEPGDEDEEF